MIRRACKSDSNSLKKMIVLHADYEQVIINESNVDKKLQDFDYDNLEMVEIFVVEIDRVIVGYFSLTKQFSTWDVGFYIYLDCLYLLDEVRGQGIGRSIMDFVKNHASSMSCNLIRWQTPVTNEQAIRFYDRTGACSTKKERYTWYIRGLETE